MSSTVHPDGGARIAPSPPEARYERPEADLDPDASLPWLRRLVPLLRTHGTVVTVALIATFVTHLLRIAVPRIVMGAIDTALVGRSGELGPFVFLLAGLAIARLGIGMAQRYHLFKASALIEYDLRTILQRHLGGQSSEYFDRGQTGQLISRASSDVRTVEMFLTFAPAVLVSFVPFVVALGLMVRIHLPLTLVAVSALPFVYWSGRRMRNVLFPLAWLAQARKADVATVVEENLSGAHVVRGMAAEEDQIRRLGRAAERLRWSGVQEARARSVYQPLLENLPRLALALVVLYGGWLAMEGTITVGALVAFTGYVLLLQSPFRVLGFIVTLAQRARASAGRIFEIVDSEPRIRESPSAIELRDPVGDLRLRDVRFGYGDGPDVLDGLSLRVRPGERLALVGRTGSGKTTVTRLISRYYDVRDGTVQIDGHDVRDLSTESLRAAVGTVNDEPFLFSASAADNIAYGRPDAPAEAIVRAARAARAEPFIEHLPDGYDTVIGDRGSTLSGGQRQRLAIARVLLADPRILILDDATSAVDVEVEREIHAALETLLEDRTTLIIGHRLSTIALADRVALLQHGRIVAEGTHEQLLDDVPAYAEVLAQDDGQQRGDRHREQPDDDPRWEADPGSTRDLRLLPPELGGEGL